MSVIDKIQNFSAKIQPFFDKFGADKVHLSPEVFGCLKDNGEPIGNQLILRSLSFSDGKPRKDFVYTDSDGSFRFPEKTIRSDEPSIPFKEIFTNQYITTTINRKKFIIWRATLIGKNPIDEFNNKLSCLNADINNEAILFSFSSNREEMSLEGTSICRWDKDFEVIDVDEHLNLTNDYVK
ncbi:DUF6795 domain-containing protein [Pseudoalteromonas sp. Angola-4]|uniref:DUF6795 domain-containing protein n=1 Tax=Pseudoalteromonas sp. Angola-4 TaxID=3025335 RepID=UPI0023592F41|nr:DUF6795 domain-containing protein [Pseudoalteromonas sp. Angola-4]MDC9509980.1 hypothetical protein [Pseudoalteromonas sp. Angola-4]